MINDLIKQCEEVALHPKKYVNDYVTSKNVKAVGMAPLFGPTELVHAAGMLPVGLWGTETKELDLSKQYFPAFCASLIMAIMESGLDGTYSDLSACIIPGMSDTLNSFGQNWKHGIKEIKHIPIVYPQMRKEDFGIKFLVEELKDVKAKLEEVSGNEITEENLQKSIELFNEHRKEMRDFSELAASHPNTIDNKKRMFVYKSAQYMAKEEHLELIKKINEELRNLPEEKYEGKRVVTTGIHLDDVNILETLEEFNLRIVGDLMAQESIQYNTDVPEDGVDGLERIAKQWRDIEGFTAAYDPKKLRGKMVGELAKERDAVGAIFALVKFSDFEEYDMPICLQDIRDAGIPVVNFEIDHQDKSSEQVKTRIQTFSEII